MKKLVVIFAFLLAMSGLIQAAPPTYIPSIDGTMKTTFYVGGPSGPAVASSGGTPSGSLLAYNVVFWNNILGKDNLTALVLNIPVSGTDAGAHTMSLQIDSNTGMSIAATGNGAGGVGVLTIGIGQTAGADVVGIGDANADVSITDANWTIAANGTPNFLDNSLPGADITDDSLDFTELSDTLGLDGACSITGTAAEILTINRTLTNATDESGIVINVTPSDTTAGTTAQYGLSLGCVASTEGLDSIMWIGNADTDDACVNGIQIYSAAGTITNALNIGADVTNFASLNGTTISMAEAQALDGGITLTTETNGDYVASVGTSALTGLTGGAAGSEGATLTLGFDRTATIAADPAIVAGGWVPSTTGIIFEGSTADGIETLLTLTDPTAADKTINFPNASGTVAVSASSPVSLSALGDIGITADAIDFSHIADALTPEAATYITGADTVGADPALGANSIGFGTEGIIFEGATANAFEGLLTAFDFDADRTFTLPNVSGTLLTTGDTASVTSTIIADISRQVQVPITSVLSVASTLSLDASAADTEPDFVDLGTGTIVIAWDDTAGSIDSGYVMYSFVVPTDYISGGSFLVLATQDAATGANTESIDLEAVCQPADGNAANVTWSINAATNLASQTTLQTLTFDRSGITNLAAGRTVTVKLAQGNGSADDIVYVHSVVFSYTAAQ